ncbi:MAG: acetate CoA/acetoacetate CoA-transferase alpha subunit [Clostridiales bacterium]|nr:acetate CoA/acetoacetate CoA-transferase alpha subunit [Clostridiales bacterium]MDN5299391.1 acetate CoA/acetoacetate CoA-transferase alpha subunit [Clostridiales bacterium]
MVEIIGLQEAAEMVSDGATVMIGGFIGVGGPNSILEALIENNVKDLTIISNDTVTPELGIGKLVVNKQIKKAIVTHIGTNPETGRQMNAGELEVELVPQGTLAERIRAGGAGLGGVLTKAGLKTPVEEGKRKLEINGQDYLLEMPLKADIALLKASKADKAGNLYYNGSTRNFNPVMATAAELVIAEVDEIVEIGEINPNDVMTPGIFVNFIVKGGR